MSDKIEGRKLDLTDRAFRIGLILKALNGLAETVGGILLLIVTPEQINRWAASLTQDELSQDPHDFVASHILKSAHHLSGGSLVFGAIYLLSHGLIKLVLVVEVIRDHLWAYKALVVVLALFIIYQLYRILFTGFSWGMTLLTILDFILIYLTAVEYQRHKAWHEKRHKKPLSA
jgi:uncharacterized membrane protein